MLALFCVIAVSFTNPQSLQALYFCICICGVVSLLSDSVWVISARETRKKIMIKWMGFTHKKVLIITYLLLYRFVLTLLHFINIDLVLYCCINFCTPELLRQVRFSLPRPPVRKVLTNTAIRSPIYLMCSNFNKIYSSCDIHNCSLNLIKSLLTQYCMTFCPYFIFLWLICLCFIKL